MQNFQVFPDTDMTEEHLLELEDENRKVQALEAGGKPGNAW
jgi:hypothetical protein